MHRLALQLGRTVSEIEQTLTVAELQDWIEFAKVEPFGEVRADAQMAMLIAMYANANRDTKQHKEPYDVEDFRLVRPSEERRELAEGEVLVTHRMMGFLEAIRNGAKSHR